MPPSISLSVILQLDIFIKQGITKLFKNGFIDKNTGEHIKNINKMLDRVEDAPKVQISETGKIIKPEKKPVSKKIEITQLPDNIDELDGTFKYLKADNENIAFMNEFIEEITELIKTSEENLLKLELIPDNMEVINNIFRHLHSIKGAAGMMALEEIQLIAHRCENILDKCRNSEITVNNDMINILLKSVDFIGKLFSNLLIRVKILRNEIKDTEIQIINIKEILEDLTNILAVNKENKVKKVSGSNIAIELPDDSHITEQDSSNNETLEIFLQESAEDIAVLNQSLIEYEKDFENTGMLNKIFRTVHKLKSAADAFEYTILKELMHNLEEVLSALRENRIKPENKIINAALKCADIFSESIIQIKNGSYKNVDISEINNIIKTIISQKETVKINDNMRADIHYKKDVKSNLPAKKNIQNPANTSSSPCGEFSAESIRVDLHKLDKLINQTGELVISKAAIIQLANGLSRTLNDNESDTNKIRHITISLLEESLRMERLVSQIQTSVMATRMVTIDNLFKKYTRVIRDLALENKKNILMSVSGQETELDKRVIEELGDPLMHMVRNSVDHGLETPEERTRKGKDPQSKIDFSAYREGSSYKFEG